ncbi:MAG: Crp/Fnr family transcriptional regulator, partial [Comamonas sp.]
MPESTPAHPPLASGSRRAASSVVQSDLWAILQAGRWFSALPPALAEQLRALAKPRLLAAGEWLFRRGDAPCGLYAVARGALTIAGTAAMGEQTRTALLTLVEPPMWLGEIALFDQAPRSHDAYAATHCTLLHIAHQPLRQWLEANPQYWRDMALLLTDKLRNCLIALEEQTVLPAPQRLAHRLVQMAQSYDQWNDSL